MEPFGPYLLIKMIGRGGNGEVHLATPVDANTGMPELVVIKRLLPELSDELEFVQRFHHEAKLATSIDSPYVARVFEVGAVGSTLYFSQELIRGSPLSHIWQDLHDTGRLGALPWMIDLISGVLLGLRAIHTATDPAGEPLGIVHRDIAPKNIMITRTGFARLIDLGIGRSNLRDWETRTGVVMGTAGYMAPEQVLGRAVDHRTDLYATGVVLWELATASHFIERGPVQQMLRASVAPVYRPVISARPDLPAELDDVLRRALAHAPADRFQSAEQFLDALETLLPSGRRTRVVEREEAPDTEAIDVVQLRSSAITDPAYETQRSRTKSIARHSTVRLWPKTSRRSSRLLRFAVFLGIAAAAFAGTIAWMRRPREQQETAPPPAAVVVAPPSATPIVVEREAEVLDAGQQARVPRNTGSRKIAQVPVEAPPPPAVVETPIEEYVDGLIQRAVILTRKYPSRPTTEVVQVLNELNILRGSSRLWKARAEAELLERKLALLERELGIEYGSSPR